MHGAADALVSFDNAVTKRDAVIAAFELAAGEVVASGDGYSRTRHGNARGTEFELFEHDYRSASAVGVPPLGVAIEGHCYPGSTDLTLTEPGQLMAFGCEPPTAFTWGESVIEFFIAHPRR